MYDPTPAATTPLHGGNRDGRGLEGTPRSSIIPMRGGSGGDGRGGGGRKAHWVSPAPWAADRRVVRILLQVGQPGDDPIKVGADVTVNPEEVCATPPGRVEGLTAVRPDAVGLVRVFDEHLERPESVQAEQASRPRACANQHDKRRPLYSHQYHVRASRMAPRGTLGVL